MWLICAYALGPGRIIHEQKLQAKQGAHDEAHDSAGDYVKSMIFGGLDGILTSFAIVAGAAGKDVWLPSW